MRFSNLLIDEQLFNHYPQRFVNLVIVCLILYFKFNFDFCSQKIVFTFLVGNQYFFE